MGVRRMWGKNQEGQTLFENATTTPPITLCHKCVGHENGYMLIHCDCSEWSIDELAQWFSILFINPHLHFYPPTTQSTCIRATNGWLSRRKCGKANDAKERSENLIVLFFTSETDPWFTRKHGWVRILCVIYKTAFGRTVILRSMWLPTCFMHRGLR